MGKTINSAKDPKATAKTGTSMATDDSGAWAMGEPDAPCRFEVLRLNFTPHRSKPAIGTSSGRRHLEDVAFERKIDSEPPPVLLAIDIKDRCQCLTPLG